MAEVQHSQIKNKLLELVAPLIDKSDILSKSPADNEAHILSRSVAAAAVKILGDTDDAAAANSVVDGGKDNGIDAIYYDTQSKALFLIQSKWSNGHTSSIESGEVLKFLQGVQDLVSLKRDRFNEKIQKRWSIIEDALKKLTSVRLVVAYPGSGKIDPDIQDKIDDFVKGQNDTSELFFFSAVTQRELFQHFVSEAAPPQINLNVRLTHYGLVESPLRAVYGQVSAVDVAEWYRRHGNHLFAGNIRNFLGSSEVNAAIAETLKSEATFFWYYNNGITIIIEAITTLACASDEMSYVALAKGYVGGLYADITAAPYKALFNAATSSRRLWSLVQLERRIDKAVKTLSDQASPTERGIVVHGNRFIMHCVIRRVSSSGDISNSAEISNSIIEDAVKHVLAGVRAVIESTYRDAYLAPLFKNVKKCSDIRRRYEGK